MRGRWRWIAIAHAAAHQLTAAGSIDGTRIVRNIKRIDSPLRGATRTLVTKNTG